MNAGQTFLCLVAAGGDDMPFPSAVDSACCHDQIGWSLESAGVFSGAWLVVGASRKMCGGRSASLKASVVPVLASPP